MNRDCAEDDLPPTRVRFDRNELAGSFGDVGTDLPLLLAMIAAAGLQGSTVFIIFGTLQIVSGLFYGLPMPMQPLKAMAVLVITQKIGGDVFIGAGLAIAVVMLLLTVSGALRWLTGVIPHPVVRGVQFGLGVSLGMLALREYIPSQGPSGFVLAGVGAVMVIALWGNRRVPAALLVIGLGLAYAAVWTMDWSSLRLLHGLRPPMPAMPTLEAVWTGLFVLALPQLPLSLSNSVIATEQTVRDLFPDRSVSVTRIGMSYGVANVASSLFGGVPVCHGCGGLAGHYAFGARTGGSVVIYGSAYILLGVLLGDSVGQVVAGYPKPILGVILFFEAIVLMLLLRDVSEDRRALTVALMTGLLAAGVQQGFLVGLLVGTATWYGWRWHNRTTDPTDSGRSVR